MLPLSTGVVALKHSEDPRWAGYEYPWRWLRMIAAAQLSLLASGPRHVCDRRRCRCAFRWSSYSYWQLLLLLFPL